MPPNPEVNAARKEEVAQLMKERHIEKERKVPKRHGKECKETGSVCGKSAEDCPYKRGNKKAKTGETTNAQVVDPPITNP